MVLTYIMDISNKRTVDIENSDNGIPDKTPNESVTLLLLDNDGFSDYTSYQLVDLRNTTR